MDGKSQAPDDTGTVEGVVPAAEPRRRTVADVIGRPAPDDVRSLGAGASVVLDDPAIAWLVEAGPIDVFALLTGEDVVGSAREFLFSVETGDLLFGMAAGDEGTDVELIAVGWEESRISRIDLTAETDRPLGADEARYAAQYLDRWIWGVTEGVTKHISERATPQEFLGFGEEVTVAAGGRMTSRRGVVWAHLLEGIVRLIDIDELDAAASSVLVPVTSRSWLQGRDDVAVKGYATASVLQGAGWRQRMDLFHGMALRCLVYDFRNAAAGEIKRLRLLAEKVEEEKGKTLWRFASLLDEKRGRDSEFEMEDPLFQASTMVAKALGIKVVEPFQHQKKREDDPPLSLEVIARASRIRTRQVALRGRWWTEDNGPLVAFVEDGQHPIALLQKSGKKYEAHDPVSGTKRPVNTKLAMTLSPIAYSFYPPFPDRKIGAWDLVKFGMGRCKADLAAIVGTGAIGGILGIATPLATALVFDAIIPGHEKGQLYQIGLGLLVAAFASLAFKITGDIAMLRIEGKIAGSLQAAVLDRLLRLPNAFFANYSAGDLAQRTMMVESIRRAVTGIVISSIMAGVFSVFSYALLFYYEPRAALVATVLMILLLGVTVLTGIKRLQAIMQGEALSGSIYSLVLQIVTGITKLRLAGAEDRAFNLWGKTFGELRSRMVRSKKVSNLFTVFSAGYEILALAAIFGVVAMVRDEEMTTGIFLAFVAAFTTFLGSISQMARSIIQVFSTVPMYKRATPILEGLPEVDDTKEDPGRLTGAIEVNRATFRYSKETPRILDGVTMRIEAGEFVAIVGPSGCGKSTLMKLLLGFEKPEAGGVYYDGQEVRGIDLTALRRQIGVVLQAGKLMPGSIYENIRGATDCSVDDAWDAARQSGMDEDIQQMPMGMHTVLTEGSSALSGGQVQRLLIARALVAKPRVLLFDEATSALDNRTQAVITQSLDRLSVTRIAIAHRLSTVLNADCIYVLSGGKIAESGNYDDLMKQNGIFADLARRQLT
jgi:NHLM bacteriocin system ABC transporter ATP-binding protein